MVGSTNVTLSNLDIGVGDDNIAFKSGLPMSSPARSRRACRKWPPHRYR